MSDRIEQSVRFSRMVNDQRKRCNEGNCVNWKCDGTRHFNIAGNKWGDGWDREEQ